MSKLKAIELSESYIFELTVLAYDNWTKSVDELRQIRTSKRYTDPNWLQYHGEQLRSATTSEVKALKLLDAIRKYCHV